MFGGENGWRYAIMLTGVLALVIVALFLEEPEGHMAEVLPDGTVQMIEVT